jgi:hypothetical protein
VFSVELRSKRITESTFPINSCTTLTFTTHRGGMGGYTVLGERGSRDERWKSWESKFGDG